MKNFGLTVTGLTNLELIEGVQRAVDNKLRRIVSQARLQWEQRFAGPDPTGACVSVTIAAAPESPARLPVRGSAFVKVTKAVERRPNIRLPHFAH